MSDGARPEAEFARSYLTGFGECLDSLSLHQVADVIACLERAYEDGSQVFVMGNGGSAATASHMAVDLGKTVLPADSNGTRRFRVTSLTDNVPWMTAIANDLGYEHVFAEQLRNHISPGDVVVAITGSGNSPNIVEGVRVALEHGATTIGLRAAPHEVIKGRRLARGACVGGAAGAGSVSLTSSWRVDR